MLHAFEIQIKYSCIHCAMPLCNVCSISELNVDTCGWIAGKRIGYCKPCKENLLSKGKLKIDRGNQVMAL